jgi:hypothetical protein
MKAKSIKFEMHKQGVKLYTEESPLNERGIEPLSFRHKQEAQHYPKN